MSIPLNSMRKYNLLILVLICVLTVSFSACKKSGREAAEAVMGKVAKNTAKEVAEESAEKTLKTIGRKELTNLDWDDLLKIIKKENVNLSNAISKLDRSFQKNLCKAMNSDYDFFKAITSSNTMLDEFKILTKESPKATNNINLLKYYAKGKNLERRFGLPSQIPDLRIIEEGNVVSLFNKADNRLIGKLKDGIFTLDLPNINGSSLFSKESILKKGLIPNTTYKIRGKEGLSYLYHTDDLGRITKIEANGIDANALSSNIVYLRENINLGSEWSTSLKKIRQTSKGNDIKATVNLKYADENMIPSFAKADVSANNKSLVSKSFENLDNMSRKTFATIDNAKVLDRFGDKIGLSAQKRATLLDEMGKDKELAKLIHSDPEFNVKRWLNSREKPNRNLIKARKANGAMPPNWEYSGKAYYFHPGLNPKIQNNLAKDGYITIKGCGNFSYEDFVKLDRLYPEGVPFTKEGFPDFSKVAFKDKNGNPLIVTLKTLTGDSKKDISLAKKAAEKMGYQNDNWYTWHHIENSNKLMRVPYIIHEHVRHVGGMSTHAQKQTLKQAA